MSIDNITSKILSEAENNADSSLMNAESTKQEIINKAKSEAEVIIRLNRKEPQRMRST